MKFNLRKLLRVVRLEAKALKIILLILFWSLVWICLKGLSLLERCLGLLLTVTLGLAVVLFIATTLMAFPLPLVAFVLSILALELATLLIREGRTKCLRCLSQTPVIQT